jgi:hypothetical protein
MGNKDDLMSQFKLAAIVFGQQAPKQGANDA